VREEEVGMTRPRPAPIRPLGVAEILDEAVRLVRRNLRAVLVVSVPFAIVQAGLAALLQYATIDPTNVATVGVLGTLLVGLALGTVLTGLLAPLFSIDLLGTRISARESVQRVGRRIWALILLAVVVTVAEGAGLVALVVGGVWLWGLWAVAAPALVLEGTGMRDALSRSLRLVRGTFWRAWGIRALGWLLVTVLRLFIGLPFEALAAWVTGSDLLGNNPSISSPAVYVAIVAVGAVVSGALLTPISAAIDVLLYTDLRMRKEGMDIVLALPPLPDVPDAGRPAVSAW
jgi:hypothetical protein